MKSNFKIAALLTCHNRRDKTLSCLHALFQASLPPDYKLDVYLVDDGSTDGTGKAINEGFPDVKLIQGDGNLYWNRGMHLAWDTATRAYDYDYYLWLNDDVILFQDSLIELLDVAKTHSGAIVCGITCSAGDGQEITYGGYAANGTLLVPNGSPQLCPGVFNGNIVLVSRGAYDKVGNLDPKFWHAIGDFDYAMRARKKSVDAYVTPGISGVCERNESLSDWCLPNIKLSKRLRSLYSPLGKAQPQYFFIYELRHYGIVRAVKHLLTIHLRVLIPSLWK